MFGMGDIVHDVQTMSDKWHSAQPCVVDDCSTANLSRATFTRKWFKWTMVLDGGFNCKYSADRSFSRTERTMPMDSDDENPLADHPRYVKVRELNRGAFGFVFLAEDALADENVAIKFLPRGPRINVNVEREILDHKNLLHHHVIQFKGVFLTQRHLAIVMEYAPGGDLMDYIRQHRSVSEELARWFFQQLIIGLDYCHLMGVANRDIKLENILLDDSPWPLVKICDFECLTELIEYDIFPPFLVATRSYLPPEVVFRENPMDPYDGKMADVWRCGVLLYVMMVRRYPFVPRDKDPSQHIDEISERLRNLDYEIPQEAMSSDCADLIRKILVSDPTQRLTIKDIQNHPWYKRDLPEGALDMNEHAETQPDYQTEAEILSLCRDARIRL